MSKIREGIKNLFESREEVKDSKGLRYVVQFRKDGKMQMSRISPYDLTDYCFAVQELRDPSSDDHEDVIWKIYSPNGKLVGRVGDIGWDAVADKISSYNDKLGLSSKIDRT